MKKLLYFTFLVICIQLLSSTSSIAQQDKIITTYSGESEIKATKSITLGPGFYIPAPATGKSVRIFILKDEASYVFSHTSPSKQKDYIITSSFKVPNVTSSNIGLLRTLREESQEVQYFDGLGRPDQNIKVQGSSTFRDIIQPSVYDYFGRETKEYLPYVAALSNSGDFKRYWLAEQSTFYSNPTAAQAPGVVSMASGAFSEKVFENSPLNRVVEIGAAGIPWQISNGHTIKVSYGTNNTDTLYTTTGFAVQMYDAVIDPESRYQRTLSRNSFYAAGQLSLTINKDENWVSTDGKAGTVEEYKDKNDRVILKRIFNKKDGAIETLSTYYVYDDFGNLSYVLPPGANPDKGTVSQTLQDNYCYQYRYDGRQRLIEKKIPGTTKWASMVYNKLDQLVLMQDARQAGEKEIKNWHYTKYDAFGHEIITGIYPSNSTREVLQTASDANNNLWEKRSGTSDYTNTAIPTGAAVIYSRNYYDDYAFPEGGAYTYSAKSSRTKGQLTGSKVLVVGGAQATLVSLNFYDDEGRMVKNFKQHYLSGGQNTANYDETLNNYNFGSELTKSTRVHHAGTATTTIVDTVTYDHMGRKLITSNSINGSPLVILSKQDYNEVGQLLKKSLHSTNDGDTFLQNSSYSYNERGWLKNNTSTQFGFELKYQDGTSPQYNGNISGQTWVVEKNAANTFTYSYDKLNRLLSGVSTGVVMSETLSYDVMGNIKTLNRDNILGTYAYVGNQLTRVTGGTLGTGVYVYDTGGNVITDGRNGVSINYLEMNLPNQITKSGLSITYAYDAAGDKLRKTSGTDIRHYIDGIEYSGNKIDIIHTEEGIARNSDGIYSYEYNLSDHLGNVRYSFKEKPSGNAIQVLQKDDYYAFGLRKIAQEGNNKYLYNGKELQEELGQLDYGARFYDPVIGRFNAVDPMSEMSRRFSPYSYALNNPIRFIDVDGMYAASPVFDQEGSFLGTDDQGMKGSDIIMKREDFKQGMSHKEAVKKDLGIESLDLEATRNWYSFSKSIYSRPDFDGFVSIQEGVDWAKANPGALNKPTPENALYLDASKLDFGNIATSDLINGVGKSSPVNLNNVGNFFASSKNATLASTVYALGRVDLTLLNNKGSVKVVNNIATDYDWNRGGGAVRSNLIGYERWRAKLNDNHGFKAFYYGTGHLKK